MAALDPDATPRRIALVVLGPDGTGMTGFLVASLLPPQAELEIIAVDARFQRRGLARKLFEDWSTSLRIAGVTEVILEVRASNQAALEFYRVLGFVETWRRPRYYADPEEDAVLMSAASSSDSLRRDGQCGSRTAKACDSGHDCTVFQPAIHSL